MPWRFQNLLVDIEGVSLSRLGNLAPCETPKVGSEVHYVQGKNVMNLHWNFDGDMVLVRFHSGHWEQKLPGLLQAVTPERDLRLGG